MVDLMPYNEVTSYNDNGIYFLAIDGGKLPLETFNKFFNNIVNTCSKAGLRSDLL